MADIPATEDHEPLSPARRARILAGAGEIFVADGYEGASMSRIAARAQVSKGTLYNYFPGKRELFGAFVRDSCALMVEEIFREVAPEATAREGLLWIGRQMLKMMISPLGMQMFRLAVMEAAKFPELAANFTQAGPDRLVKLMTAWLEGQIAAGALKIADPRFAAEQYFALTQSRLVLRARIDPAYRVSEADIDQVVNGAAELCIAAWSQHARS